LADAPALATLCGAVSDLWPSHDKYLAKSIDRHTPAELATLESFGVDILKIIGGDLARHAAHYKWMCQAFTKEAMHFLRTGEYRCKTFAEADAAVYSNHDFMSKYMDGLLVSQALWANHAQCAIHYKDRFLPRAKLGARYLEVGPGHGLFLSQAARQANIETVTAWDVSAESLAQTRAALNKMGADRPIALEQRNVLAGGGAANRFDAIVISEVLEHLEQPQLALATLRGALAPDGLLCVNVPVNSPAPDHIYLLKSVEEAVALVRDNGFTPKDVAAYPMTGYTLESAAAERATINVVVLASPKAGA
jgi:2-polyprenyl-3-methyl-5-hydroxy-6-metoxy-1,4-benzoquinol methylase